MPGKPPGPAAGRGPPDATEEDDDDDDDDDDEAVCVERTVLAASDAWQAAIESCTVVRYGSSTWARLKAAMASSYLCAGTPPQTVRVRAWAHACS
jgi:hypothetical protein